MVFSSLPFLFAFLPLFFLFYFAAGKIAGIRGKNLILFLFSLLFYAWGEPRYVLLMIYSTLLDYSCGRIIEAGIRKESAAQKKAGLALSLVGNLGLLCVFKYSGMLVSSFDSVTGLSLPVPEILLPIGISFYTFQTMSYSIDVYRGKVAAQHDLIRFGAYVAMFPQLIAGPVVRYETIEKELTERTETKEDLAEGIRRFILGLSKKTLIANLMAQTADSLFENSPAALGSLGAWVAILAYTFQIFFDFSGYSDMAIGMGRMMGFHYLENFNYPYIADSVTDFWRRWHISMSSFFRDYVYIPLGGNRCSKGRWVFNLFAVWFLTGLWHGASWNFVLWGLYFGILLLLEKTVFLPLLKKTRVFSHLWAMFFVVMGWVIFTQEDLTRMGSLFKALFGGYGFLGEGNTNALILLQHAEVNTLFLLAFLAAVVFSLPVAPRIRDRISSLTGPIRTACGIGYDIVLFLLLGLCTVQLALGSYNPFIYFRF